MLGSASQLSILRRSLGVAMGMRAFGLRTAAAVSLGSLVTLAAAQDLPQPPASDKPIERGVTILPGTPDRAARQIGQPIGADQLEALNLAIKLENSAGLTLDIIPGREVVAGSKVGFRITTRKQGYLILLDIDAAGKLRQIFPNADAASEGRKDAANLVKPGQPLTIPQLGTAYASFEFIAEPPAGVAMVVALLSDKPVQIVDLPDAPPPAFAPNDSLKYVVAQTKSLMIPRAKGSQMDKPSWSFDGKFYLIK
jgi:hypothetical protein